MKSNGFASLFLGVVGIVSVSGAGKVYTWTGAVDSDWNLPENWAGAVPYDEDPDSAGLTGDMTIIIDGKYAPDSDVPLLDGHIASHRNTPRIQLNKGRMDLRLKERWGWWVGENHEILCIGNGVEVAELNLHFPDPNLSTFSRTLKSGQINSLTVNSHGTLHVHAVMGLVNDEDSALQITIKSGGTLFLAGLLNRWGTKDSHIALESGARLELELNGDYQNVTDVEQLLGTRIIGVGNVDLCLDYSSDRLIVTTKTEGKSLGLLVADAGAQRLETLPL